MPPFPRRFVVAVAAIGACLTTAATSHRPDRRIVDSVEAGNAASEAPHGYAGDSVSVGSSGGKSFRQTRSWMHYSLKTFEDTPVTVACTFIGTDANARTFDLVVEDSVVASRTLTLQKDAPTVVEIAVPFAVTKGKSHVSVVLRARGGLTPALQLLRTVQEHYEQH